LHATALLPAKKPGLWLHDVTPALQLVKTFHRFAEIYFSWARLSSTAAMDHCSAIPKPTRAQKTSLHPGRKVRFSSPEFRLSLRLRTTAPRTQQRCGIHRSAMIK
jgi:hypothetical protein